MGKAREYNDNYTQLSALLGAVFLQKINVSSFSSLVIDIGPCWEIV